MFTHRFASTHHRLTPRGLAIALAVSLALGGLSLAQASQHASAVLVHQRSQPESRPCPAGHPWRRSQLQTVAPRAITTGTNKAAQHSIIFVGGRKQGGAHHAMNPRVIPALPPGPPLKRSHSIGGDRSLNSQPDYQGHRPIDSMAKCMPHKHRPSIKHEQPTPHPC